MMDTYTYGISLEMLKGNSESSGRAPTTRAASRKSVPPPSNSNSDKRSSWQPPNMPPSSGTSDLIAPRSEFCSLKANSPSMQNTLGLMARYAPAEVTVTLMGETGSGKDVIAHAMHSGSPRANGPIVVLDCGAIASSLAESEVLGHERGAFTGAITSHAGAFERARGGTLFLDEIGEMPLDLQTRLLRAIDNRHGRRVGGNVDRAFDVRIIAATNRDLRMEVAEGRFRQDLFYRLGAAIIPVPPLRGRLEDLTLLVPNLLADVGKPNLAVTEQAYAAMRMHGWPGNIRELKNTLACAVAFVDPGSDVLDAPHINSVWRMPEEWAPQGVEQLPLGGQLLERIERAAIYQTLLQTEGNKVRAAQVLGIAVSTLYEKIKRYRLGENYAEK